MKTKLIIPLIAMALSGCGDSGESNTINPYELDLDQFCEYDAKLDGYWEDEDEDRLYFDTTASATGCYGFTDNCGFMTFKFSNSVHGYMKLTSTNDNACLLTGETTICHVDHNLSTVNPSIKVTCEGDIEYYYAP